MPEVPMTREQLLRRGDFEQKYKGRTIGVRLKDGNIWQIASLPIVDPDSNSKRNKERRELVKAAENFPVRAPGMNMKATKNFVIRALQIIYPKFGDKDYVTLDFDSRDALYVFAACVRLMSPAEVNATAEVVSQEAADIVKKGKKSKN